MRDTREGALRATTAGNNYKDTNGDATSVPEVF